MGRKRKADVATTEWDETEEEVQPKSRLQRLQAVNPSQEFDPEIFFFPSPIPKSRSETWSNLTLLGPYHFLAQSQMKSSMRNRMFFNLIRRIFDRIHENLLQFRDYRLQKLVDRITGDKIPNVNQLMEILEEMSRKVFFVEDVNDSSSSIDLYEDGVLKPLRQMFFQSNIEIRCDSEEILRRLKTFCSKNKVFRTSDQLEEAQRCLVRYLLHVNADFLVFLFNWNKRRRNNTLTISGLANRKLHEKMLFMQYSSINLTSHLETFFSSCALDRSRPPVSLWISLPCEEKEHLLEAVFDYGLIELFPEELKTFLTQWLLGVRKRMRKRLIKGDLRKVIELVMSESEENEELSLDDERVEQFVVKIMENVLNTEEFRIFASHWQKYTLELIKEGNEKVFGKFPDAQKILHDVAERLDGRSLSKMNSFFTRKKTLPHVLVQLLRFVVILAFNTIGHVFHYDHSTRKLRYDGEFDEEITDFSKFEQDESEREEKPSPQVVSARYSQLGQPRPRKTLLPTPPSYQNQDSDPAAPPPFYRPPPSSFPHSNGIPMNPFQNQVPQVSNFAPEGQKKSFFYNPCPPTPISNLAPDPIDEELSSARALRTPSVISGSVDQFDEDDEHIPDKWKKAYRLTLEWNKDLKEELERVKARLNMISL